jgi:hypothetical protein
MSLINDALNKVQQQRGAKLTPKAVVRYGSAQPQSQVQTQPATRISPAMWVLINAGVLVLVLVGNHYFSRRSTSDTPRVVQNSEPTADSFDDSSSPVVRAAPEVERRVSPAPSNLGVASPFVPAANRTPVESAAEPEYDLAGMTMVGKNTLLSIVRRSDQRSFWVPVGKTVGEITAVSYNVDNDDAVIRVRGKTMTIGMRNASVLFNPLTTPSP